jgi:hypothetical protein
LFVLDPIGQAPQYISRSLTTEAIKEDREAFPL